MIKVDHKGILHYVENVVCILDSTPAKEWAEEFVLHRMYFFKEFCNGEVLTTEHGAEFFDNLLAHLYGAPYTVMGKDGKLESGKDKAYTALLKKWRDPNAWTLTQTK